MPRDLFEDQQSQGGNQPKDLLAGGQGSSEGSGLVSYGRGLLSGGLDTVKNYASSFKDAMENEGPMMGAGPAMALPGNKVDDYVPKIQEQLETPDDSYDYDLGRSVGYGVSQYGPALVGGAQGLLKGLGKGIQKTMGKPTYHYNNDNSKWEAVKEPIWPTIKENLPGWLGGDAMGGHGAVTATGLLKTIFRHNIKQLGARAANTTVSKGALTSGAPGLPPDSKGQRKPRQQPVDLLAQ